MDSTFDSHHGHQGTIGSGNDVAGVDRADVDVRECRGDGAGSNPNSNSELSRTKDGADVDVDVDVETGDEPDLATVDHIYR